MTQRPTPPTTPERPVPAERDPFDALLDICNQQAELAAEAAGHVERARKHAQAKSARAEEVLAAFDLLAKAREGL